jgi:LmbE family N-acetylglucosaminyl deacetylase
VRLDEAAAVARAIGIERTIFWREDNQAFVHRPELVDRLVAILEETRPKLIFVPFITDIHPDHVLLARILAAALGRWSEPGTIVLGYEIWSRVPANAWCDVGSVMADLEQQLLLYETAMKVDDFVHGCAARNYANALALTGRPGFVEAFFQCEVTTYRSLVEPVPGGP